MATMKNSFIKY